VTRVFDGANSMIQATITDISAPPFSYIATIYPRTAGEGSAGRILRTEQTGGTGSEFKLAAGPVLAWATNYDTVNSDAVASTALTANTVWAVCGLLGTDQICHLYQGNVVAGPAVAEVAYTSHNTGSVAAASGTNGAVIGNKSDQTLTFDGWIAHVAIFLRVLRVDEMEMYRRGYLPSGAYAYWPLTQPDTTQSYDVIAGRNGTDTLTAWTDDLRPMHFNPHGQFRSPRARPKPFRPGRPIPRVGVGGGGFSP